MYLDDLAKRHKGGLHYHSDAAEVSWIFGRLRSVGAPATTASVEARAETDEFLGLWWTGYSRCLGVGLSLLRTQGQSVWLLRDIRQP
jgi:hypothetical protein